jgi:hypothetical protein
VLFVLLLQENVGYLCEKIEALDTSKLRFGSEKSKNFLITLREPETNKIVKCMLPSRYLASNFNFEEYNSCDSEAKVTMTYVGLKGNAFNIRFS